MIGRLRGIVEDISDEGCILDVNGVGYALSVGAKTLQDTMRGSEQVFFVETLVRENDIRLIGFRTAGEQGWFRRLLTVQGVGAKVALAILGTLSPEELAQAVAGQDKGMVARANGVGAKLAARIVAELKDKIPAGDFSVAVPVREVPSANRDALAAMIGLGFKPAEAERALARVSAETDGTVEALVKAGLRELAR
ncbi:MAG TPA: Holliday junction branch migration protein RuvA [Dongiaceae bacterium]|jgi:Holliday junction DNA helicase RuvA|nr:Holliday junction branch migration protein RuvA [Dongiaceae bacterium]